MNLLYLVNQYPKTSHTFIRREIQALEELDLRIARVSIRPVSQHLLDENDRLEAELTTSLLEGGLLGLLPSVLKLLVARPFKFFATLCALMRLSHGAEAGGFKHGV